MPGQDAQGVAGSRLQATSGSWSSWLTPGPHPLAVANRDRDLSTSCCSVRRLRPASHHRQYLVSPPHKHLVAPGREPAPRGYEVQPTRDQGDSSDEPRIPDGAKYATSEQLAARYQVSTQWVESRATNLGATPISDSPNSKLRYHLTTADAYMDARRRRPPPRVRGAGGRKPKQKKRPHTRTGRPLLDVD